MDAAQYPQPATSTTPRRGDTNLVELLTLATPVKAKNIQTLRSDRRKVLPTAEETTPKQFAVFRRPGTPTVTGKTTIPFSHKVLEVRVDGPIYVSVGGSHPPLWTQTLEKHGPVRDLVLSFDLRETPEVFWDNKEDCQILYNIFPGTHGLAVEDGFLIFMVDEMPRRPYPKTVAGLPIFFAVKGSSQKTPRPWGEPVSPRNPRIASHLNYRELDDWSPLFELIISHFDSLMVSITEVMYHNTYTIVVLEKRESEVARLPHKVAGVLITYMYEDEMGRPLELKAHRRTDPTIGNPDISAYDTLRPGVRISSGYLPGSDVFFSTSAGVLIKNSAGMEMMTVAAHGFPAESGTRVLHPSLGTCRSIGELIMEVKHTDVALVRLNDGERFENVTFENTYLPGPVKLQKLATSRGRPRCETVYMDSPDTGFVEGQLRFTSRTRIPADDPHAHEHKWIYTTWLYLGQDDAKDLPRNTCGSCIWTDDGDVIGFFRYATSSGPFEGWCAGTAADELLDRGFTLANPPTTPSLSRGGTPLAQQRP